MSKDTKKSKNKKKIIIGGLILLGTAAATTALVTTVVKLSRGNQEINVHVAFEPKIRLINSKYNALDFEISNLNSKDFKLKEVEILLHDKKNLSNIYSKKFNINSDTENITFDKLNEDNKYTLEIKFDGKSVKKQDFVTKRRPKISSSKPTSTNTTFVLNDLKDFSDSLDNIEIVIENKTNPNFEPIKIKASELEVVNGSARINLKESNLGLEPGSKYTANIIYKDKEETTKLAEELSFETAPVNNVAYLFNSTNNKITFYGLKENNKKIDLEYKPFGTDVEFTKIASTNNVENNKVEITINDDLGFDNKYEFRIKYSESTDEYLTFEDNTKKGVFKTEEAPRISVETENGLNLKLDKINSNIDQDKLFVRYRDKENSGEWIEKQIKEIPGFENGNLNIQDLNSNTDYEVQLIYKKETSNGLSTTILSDAEFRTKKHFDFYMQKSTVASKKALLTFKNNNKLNINSLNNVTLKISKIGSSEIKSVNLTDSSKNEESLVQALITELEPDTSYVWSLNDNKEILSSGTLKTGKDSSIEKEISNKNYYEDKETNLIGVENRLTDGVFVSIKNTFGYISEENSNKYYPSEIAIKYYPKNEEDQYQIEKILVSLNDIKNEKIFTKQFAELDNTPYIFEVSYKNGFDENNNEILISKKFEVNYKLPEITFNKENNNLIITNLESFNGKNITVKYNDGSESALSIVSQVSEGSLNLQLSNLRSERTYDLSLEISSNDVEFISSPKNQSRASFYNLESSENLVLSSTTFETGEQQKTIWVKHERPNKITTLTDIYVILEGFKEHINRNVKVFVGSEEELNKITDNQYTSDQIKSFTGTINNDGVLDAGQQWVNGLTKSTDYKIRVYEINDNNLNKISERDYRTPEIETPNLQKLEIVSSNTNNPGFKVENLDLLKELVKGDIYFRAQKLTEERHFENFTQITQKTFSSGNDLSFNHLKFTKNNFDAFGKQGNIIYIKSFLDANDTSFNSWFNHNSDYQIILTTIVNGTEYVIASNSEDNLIHMNYNSPKFVDDYFVNTLEQNSNSSNEISAKIQLKLRDLTEYTSTEENSKKLKALYIESNDPLAEANPSVWKDAGYVTINSDDQTSIVSFSNLKPNTYYNFAFVDNDNNLILSKKRIKTVERPRLRNTTFGDTIMRYTLSGLKGTNSFINKGTYKIKYSEDESYSYESNEFVINDDIDLATYNKDFVFTLQNGLKPNTTYNYKLVNTTSQDEILLGFKDIFRTNKSQSEETIIGNDYAVVKLINPSYKLREASYSIAKRGTGDDENKTILDVLKMQYSKDSNFSNYKEFSVSLSENEADLLAIKLQDLEANTKYYYRLVKGQIKANVVKNTSNDSEEPVETLDTENPILKGEFTTFNVKTKVNSTNELTTLTFDIENYDEDTQVFLNIKKQDSTNIFDVNYDYKIVDGKIVFELPNLEENTIYDYSLSLVSNNAKIANGNFKTFKQNSTIEARLFAIDDAYRRLRLTNINDYVGKKIRIKHKLTNIDTREVKNLNDIETVLTNENNEFLWDFADLETLNKHKIDIFLLDENNQETMSIFSNEFEVSTKYTSGGDKTVTTNVRTLGNYELNKWYTIATLQEIYATEANWQDKVKESLQEIAIFGTQVSADSAYGWHKLIVQGSDHRYYRTDNGKLIYEYIFIDHANQAENRARVKGIQFELQLVGNTIQVKLLAAKVKEGTVDRRIVISEYNWNQLTETLDYKSSNGIVNQGNAEVPGRYINVGGFKFKATTIKRGVRDFSVPQVFRYTLEEGTPALNKNTPSTSGETAGSFINLNSEKQQEKYGIFNNNSFNYDVAYNKYVAKENNLLPVNGNFLITPSIYPGFARNDQRIYAPGFAYNEELRDKFFRTLKESGKIRFTGADVYNKEWIFFNSKDIVMFEDEVNAYSEKYVKEFPLAKRLIWKDGNQLKGLRLTLSDAKNGHGAVLGMLDDFVYYLDNNNINLENLTWDKFITSASKHTVHKYMNPNSPATSIAAIGFTTKNKEFINNENATFVNLQNSQFSASIESDANEDQSQSRKIKLYNIQPGSYNLKIEYPIYFPTNGNEEFTPINKTFEINSENQNYFEYNLTEDLKYNTEYKVTLTRGDEIIKVITGINAQIPGGFTLFGSSTIKNVSVPRHLNGRGQFAHLRDWPAGELRYFAVSRIGNYSNIDEYFGTPRHSSQQREELKSRISSMLIGSSRLGNGSEMKYKWSFKTQLTPHTYDNNNRGSSTQIRESWYVASVNDAKDKIYILKVLGHIYNGVLTFTLIDGKEAAITSEESQNLKNIDLNQKFNSGTSVREDLFGSRNITENDFINENSNRIGLFGIFIKDKETPESA